jgi:hypothetical protein
MRTFDFVVTVFTLLFLTPVAQALAQQTNQEFVLMNNTGLQINEVNVSPTNSQSWGANLLGNAMSPGDRVKISFDPTVVAADNCNWDVNLVFDGATPPAVLTNFNLCKALFINVIRDASGQYRVVTQ